MKPNNNDLVTVQELVAFEATNIDILLKKVNTFLSNSAKDPNFKVIHNFIKSERLENGLLWYQCILRYSYKKRRGDL